MGVVFKPGTGKGPVVILDNNISTPPTLKLKDGSVITAKRAGQGAPGAYHTSESGSGYQWVFPSEAIQAEEATLTVGGKSQVIKNTTSSWRGDIGKLQESSKGAVGSNGSGGYSDPSLTNPGGKGVFGDYTPGNINGVGAVPANIEKLFPIAAQSQYTPIKGAAGTYRTVDPIKFGKDFNPFQRKELNTNFAQGKDQAFGALDTELQGLKSYAPAAAALRASTINADNAQNQGARTDQVNNLFSGISNNLNQQTKDAATYASGKAPDAVIDSALNIGDRSAAADAAAGSGFGTGSAAARKFSDLLSAKDRIGLSQYGNQLIGTNSVAQQQLRAAPLEYNQAGSTININPTISGSQLQVGQSNSINAATTINPNNAFSSSVQQSQYISSLDQNTQTFNAENTLHNDEFNVGNLNNFALTKFNYQAGYAKDVAGGAQTAISTGIAQNQQTQATQTAAKQAASAQQAQLLQSLFSLFGTVGSAALTAGTGVPVPPVSGGQATPPPNPQFIPGTSGY